VFPIEQNTFRFLFYICRLFNTKNFSHSAFLHELESQICSSQPRKDEFVAWLWIKCCNCVNQQTTVRLLSLLMFWCESFPLNSIPFVLSSFVPNFIISFSFKIRWCLFKLPRENLGLLWSLRCITWHWCKKARLILLPSIETAIKLSLPAEMVMLIIFKTSKI
jgi:hypothetical protein